MRTTPLSSVLNWLARRMLGSAENLQQKDADSFIDHINTWTKDCWERFFWPEWTLAEQRYYRALWAAGTFAAGAEVYHDYAGPPEVAAYWRALQSTTAEPGTDPAMWEQCGASPAEPLDKYLAPDFAGANPIGTVRQISHHDPREHASPIEIPFRLSSNGYQVPTLAPNRVWIEYRLPAPQFTSTLWVATTAYTTGVLVYDAASGDCYTALGSSTNVAPASDGTKWQKVGFPLVLAEAVKRFAYVEALRDDGQNDKASVELDTAEARLADEWSKIEQQQGVTRHFNVLTRRPARGGYPGYAYRGYCLV